MRSAASGQPANSEAMYPLTPMFAALTSVLRELQLHRRRQFQGFIHHG
jgi:hypothetical protein